MKTIYEHIIVIKRTHLPNEKVAMQRDIRIRLWLKSDSEGNQPYTEHARHCAFAVMEATMYRFKLPFQMVREVEDWNKKHQEPISAVEILLNGNGALAYFDWP